MGGPTMVRAFQQSLDSMNLLASVRELRSNVVRQRTAFNRYLLVDDAQELIDFKEAAELARTSLESIKNQCGSPLPSWYEDLNSFFKATQDSASQVAAQYKGGDKLKAYDAATSTVFPKFQKLFESVNKLENEKSAEAGRLFNKVQQLNKKVGFVVFVVVLLAFAVGLIVFHSLYRAVMRPLEILKRGADEFGRGHWDHRINLSSHNEFGALASSFNAMAENVKQLQLQAIHMDRMSAVGQLAGGVAHEINNPLTAVLGQAQILLAKLKETDAFYAPLKKIEQAALRCKKIVRGLLDFSRPSQSTFEELDLPGIIQASLDLCEADLKKARITVEKRFSQNLPKAEGNSSELQQVLLNLINNSIQAMARGGTLTVETRIQESASSDKSQNNVSTRPKTSCVEVIVKDTGIGIPKEHLSRVFEPFFTTKEVGKGTGLGLAVSLGIVKKHGGDLRVESAGLNRGALFFLSLPVKKSSAAGWRSSMAA